MSNFKIVTDSTADMPKSYYEEHNVGLLHLSCIIDGVVYGKDNELSTEEFYAGLRGGKMPTTSQVNPEDAKEALLSYMEETKEILYLAFSSGLSGTFQSVHLAAEEIMEEDPEAKIIVIDTLCASAGEGLMLHTAVEMKNNGSTMQEIADFVESHALNLAHIFTVDDLFHLHRGGRVSKTTAIVGSVIGIKPLLHVDNEGHLVAVGKARGRKKSLLKLVDMMEERLGSYAGKQENVFISHGDCEEEAKFVGEKIKERCGAKNVLISCIGPVVGTHSGPGTIAVFFFADER